VPKLGSRGKASWLDQSDYLVHVVKADRGGAGDGYDTIMSILGKGVIARGPKPFGCAATRKGVEPDSQRVVCFSETPLGFLHRLAERRRTRYGIGFHQRFISKHGGARLWYLEAGSAQQRAISAQMKRASKPHDPADPIWKITPCVDFVRRGPHGYDFTWEREWRLPADLRFRPADVAFLLIPEERHTDAWQFFEWAQNDHTGPAYFCPYIDPLWSTERVSAELTRAKSRKAPPLRPSW
jgi:hypothetical protein